MCSDLSITYSTTMIVAEHKSEQTLHISPSQTSYGVSFVRILEKNDCVITAPHCTLYMYLSILHIINLVAICISQLFILTHWSLVMHICFSWLSLVNTLRPTQEGRHFPDDIFNCIFLNENVRISIIISLKFVSRCPINNIPALVQIMAWHRPGDKPLSEPMLHHSASMN